MFRSSKFPFILLLLFSPLLTTCTENKSDSIGSATELDVILDPAITSVTTDQVESSILQFRIQGVKEPFFERVSIQGSVSGKIPRSKNLLLILESGSILFNSTFFSLFDPQFLQTFTSSSNSVTLVKNDLFYSGQKVFIILTSQNTPDTKKYLNTLSQLTQKIVESSLRSISEEPVENYNEELSQTVFDSLGISVQIPSGFELTLSRQSSHAFWMRRGVGTKTEEWIVITPTDNPALPTDKEIEFKPIRNDLLAQLIQFSDGSIMKTNSAKMIDRSGLRFRGEWVTEPYPMAGIYSAKIFNSKNKMYYVEAGIYSPGRPRLLNLLRLEKSLNFNR